MSEGNPTTGAVGPEQIRTENRSRALSGAIGGAVLGALIWGLITYLTHYEVGWIAWGIGLLAGGGCAWLDGRGQGMATAAAALALLAIFVGKLLGTQFVLNAELGRIEEQMTQQTYEEMRQDWTRYAELSEPVSEERLREFMVERGYSAAKTAQEVTTGELTSFRIEIAPYLQSMAEAEPSIEEWREHELDEIRSQVSLVDAVVEDFHALDLLFAFLGISTAYGLVMGATRNDAAALAQAARNERRKRARSEAAPDGGSGSEGGEPGDRDTNA